MGEVRLSVQAFHVVMPAWVNRSHCSDIQASSAMALSLNVVSTAAATTTANITTNITTNIAMAKPKELCHREPWDTYDWRSSRKKAAYEALHPEVLQRNQLRFLAKVEDEGSSECLDDTYICFCFFWWVMGSIHSFSTLSGTPLHL